MFRMGRWEKRSDEAGGAGVCVGEGAGQDQSSVIMKDSSILGIQLSFQSKSHCKEGDLNYKDL